MQSNTYAVILRSHGICVYTGHKYLCMEPKLVQKECYLMPLACYTGHRYNGCGHLPSGNRSNAF